MSQSDPIQPTHEFFARPNFNRMGMTCMMQIYVRISHLFGNPCVVLSGSGRVLARVDDRLRVVAPRRRRKLGGDHALVADPLLAEAALGVAAEVRAVDGQAHRGERGRDEVGALGTVALGSVEEGEAVGEGGRGDLAEASLVLGGVGGPRDGADADAWDLQGREGREDVSGVRE